MAAIASLQQVSFRESNPLDRRMAVDSVLGTMAAEDESPSPETQAQMERFVAGEITLEELTDGIFSRAKHSLYAAAD